MRSRHQRGDVSLCVRCGAMTLAREFAATDGKHCASCWREVRPKSVGTSPSVLAHERLMRRLRKRQRSRLWGQRKAKTDPDYIRARNHASYWNHRDRRLAAKRAYYNTPQAHARSLVWHAAYYEAKREEIKAKVRAHYQEHREEKVAYARAYRETHREETLAKQRAYDHRKRADPAERERRNARARECYHLRKKEAAQQKREG